ncbi:anti-sigma factor family protein [Sphingopyxis panaciterrulae]|uniref:Anti-sigma factor RsiW n=1 Tax=Sphingopyxis panaciterrulae TaxID=462372 RepID=A0A7W9EQ05_9SPHN|nr:anti-sigma factor [Sphingopyxis panaciterrulae]MBB5706138.1 anti-sigma factor RsiW [Sphingopyxis panaciterrulae]
MTFDPATVAAFVDGELDDLTARRIAREAESDPALAAEIARHRALKARLTTHFAPIAEEEPPQRLRALLVDDQVDTSLADRREARRARFAPIHWGAIAASLVLGLTIGLRPWMPAAGVVDANGALVASGTLAEALDTQLASNQPADAAVRIGLSFRDETGRYCRSFEGDGLAGIGCREGSRWTLERTLRGETRPAYRQAASGDLAADAAAMMAGAPLDAAAERVARDKGWAD